MQLEFDAVLERYEQSLHRGQLAAPPALTASASNPRCGDVVSMFVETAGGRVTRASFDGAGCTISQAGADVAAELAEGRTLDEVRALELSAVLALLGPVRTRLDCAGLGLRVLQRALAVG